MARAAGRVLLRTPPWTTQASEQVVTPLGERREPAELLVPAATRARVPKGVGRAQADAKVSLATPQWVVTSVKEAGMEA